MRLGWLAVVLGTALVLGPSGATPPPDAEDFGPCADDTPVSPLVIAFAPRDPAALEHLLREQLDPGSSRYHAWLTPPEFGERFGAPAADYDAAMRWLGHRGFEALRAWPGRSAIGYQGTAGQVRAAFGARLHVYVWHGERRIAPLDRPRLPVFGNTPAAALLGLDGFARVHRHLRVAGLGDRLAPADVDRVFGLDVLHAAGDTGHGVTIGVLAIADFPTSEVDRFRTTFALPALALTKRTLEGGAGSTDARNVLEALLDTEWAGAAAPGAAIVAQIGGDTAVGPLVQAALDAVNANEADVVSVSFGLCESLLGNAGLAQFDGLARQAAAQGQTVVVASGDDGPADCRASDRTRVEQAVNGFASSPFVTAVGGTRLDPRFDAGGGATGYGGEAVWNDSASGGGASGGGPSGFFAKPVWQFGAGVPADGARDLPDVALAASPGGPGYLVVASGFCALADPFCVVGGTSVATPIWAGLAAIVVERRGGRIGLLNPELYRLGRQQAAGGAAIFHDVTIGSNALPTTAGFAAGPGFDLATGWGSFDASALAAAFGSCRTAADCDDGSECTRDDCVSGSCTHVPLPDGSACAADDVCFVDACQAGGCVLGASRCDDGDPCTSDACDAGVGCRHEPMTGVPGVLCRFPGSLAAPACPTVPPGIVARVEDARAFVVRAAAAARAGRRRQLLAAAVRNLRRAGRLVAAARHRGDVDTGCAAALAAIIRPIRSAVLHPP